MEKNKIELTWLNCKNHPPAEYENNFLIVTNGYDVYRASWHRLDGYYTKREGGYYIPLAKPTLEDWWWADLIRTVRESDEFKEIAP